MTEQTAMHLDTPAAGRATFAKVALGLIDILSDEISGTINPRGAITDTTGLQTSIEASGLIQPIGLVPQGDNGRFWLLWGHRRFTAFKSLRDRYRHLAADLREQSADEARIIEADEAAERFHDIPAILRPDVDVLDRPAVMGIMLSENSGREDIPLLQLSRAIRDLKARGVKTAQAAAILGVTLDRARVIEDLVDEVKEVQEALEAGKMDVEGFRAIRALDDEAKAEIAGKANELPEGKKMTRAQVRAEVEKSKATAKPAAPQGKPLVDLLFDTDDTSAPAGIDMLDAAELIHSAQTAVAAVLALLDNRLRWPQDAKPAVQFQFTRLVKRLESEGLAGKSGGAQFERPGFRAVDMGGDDDEAKQKERASFYGQFDDEAEEDEPASEDEDAPLSAQEQAAIALIESAAVEDVEVEYKPEAASMKFIIKVAGKMVDRKRNAAGVLKALDKLAADGHKASAETIADLQAIVKGDVQPAEIESAE